VKAIGSALLKTEARNQPLLDLLQEGISNSKNVDLGVLEEAMERVLRVVHVYDLNIRDVSNSLSLFVQATLSKCILF